jgi:DNA-binding response OmpR family regulator
MEAASESRRLKIALIDDDPDVRNVVQMLLASGGYEVVSTTDPIGAVDFVRNEDPDLVLCDIAMPLMDGYAVLKALQAEPATARYPVVFITAHREFSERVQAFRFGVVDYITKPMSREVLLKKVERVLRTRDRRAGLLQAGGPGGAAGLLEEARRAARTGVLSVEGEGGPSRVLIRAGDVVEGAVPGAPVASPAQFQELDPTREQIVPHEPSSLPLGEGALPDFGSLPEAVRTVLVADDNPFFRRFLRDLLRLHGFTVHEAEDGEAAFELAQERRPWLILTDVNMPVVDGVELCRRVRASGLLRHTPLIFLSGWDDYKDRYRGLEAGADDYLSKQTPVRELLLRMRVLMERYAGFAGRDRARAGMEGRIDLIGAAAVLQMVHLGRLTGTCALRSGNRSAEVRFREGEIVGARSGGLEGEEAVYDFLAWDAGRFEFVPGPVEGGAMGETFDQLVLEGCRRLDEQRRVATGDA